MKLMTIIAALAFSFTVNAAEPTAPAAAEPTAPAVHSEMKKEDKAMMKKAKKTKKHKKGEKAEGESKH